MNSKRGRDLLNHARISIKSYISGSNTEDLKYHKYDEKKGVFVTIYVDGNLRGCIGIVEPVYPLYKGISKAAISAATEDPRFPKLSLDELDKSTLEVSVLTKKQLIEVDDYNQYFERIGIGKDGLMIIGPYGSGLLLPVVAVEYKWGPKNFLDNLCLKAGLPTNAWHNLDNKIYKFQAEVFKESN
jgi:uncharacterized protein